MKPTEWRSKWIRDDSHYDSEAECLESLENLGIHDMPAIEVVEIAALISAQEELRYYKNEFESCAQSRIHFNDDLKIQYDKIARLENLLQDSVALLKTRDETIDRLEKENGELKRRIDEITKSAFEREDKWQAWADKQGAMPLELVDRSRELLKAAYEKEIEALKAENASLKHDLQILITGNMP